MPERYEYFCVRRWRAWSPGITEVEGWRAWLAGDTAPARETPVDVSYLPPLLRRRLGSMGRMALAVAGQCATGETALPTVFASRHGELQRTVELLQALARHEPLSPTDFSLSVHNSAAGLFSIARRDRSPATAVAAGDDTLAAGLIEGFGMLAEGMPQVLVVYADAPPPEPYAGRVVAQQAAFAAALLLRPDALGEGRCRLAKVRGRAAPPSAELRRSLIGFLLGREPLSLGACGWNMERVGNAEH